MVCSVDSPSSYALFSQGSIADRGRRLDVSYCVYHRNEWKRNEVLKENQEHGFYHHFVLCLVAEKVTGTSLLCYVLSCN